LGPPSAGERPRARVVSLCVGNAFVWIGGGAGRALGRSSGSVIKVKTTLRQKKRSVEMASAAWPFISCIRDSCE